MDNGAIRGYGENGERGPFPEKFGRFWIFMIEIPVRHPAGQVH